MNKTKAYKRWNSWLSKCPIEFRVLKSPTVDIEMIEFDFDIYIDDKIKPILKKTDKRVATRITAK